MLFCVGLCRGILCVVRYRCVLGPSANIERNLKRKTYSPLMKMRKANVTTGAVDRYVVKDTMPGGGAFFAAIITTDERRADTTTDDAGDAGEEAERAGARIFARTFTERERTAPQALTGRVSALSPRASAMIVVFGYEEKRRRVGGAAEGEGFPKIRCRFPQDWGQQCNAGLAGPGDWGNRRGLAGGGYRFLLGVCSFGLICWGLCVRVFDLG